MIISKFSGEHAFLSNFYPATIIYRDVKFPTVEHAYQASKSSNYDEFIKISKIPAHKPGLAKQFGKEVLLRPDWKYVKVEIMTDLINLKFQIPTLMKLLLETDNSELIEGNYWHDNFWGVCICKKCQQKEKQNILGKILMQLREVLQNENINHR